jgi:hypothetical protein
MLRSLRATIGCLVVIAGVAGASAGAAPGIAGDVPAHWTPPAQLTWYWQLQGKVSNGQPVAAYDIDGFETGATQVSALHALGKHVICYIDVGTAENFRPDYSSFPASVLGKSNGWPGEKWIDIRKLEVVEPIMAQRFERCREKGFDAVEPDNIEAFENESGFPITAAQQLTYNEWVADQVHSLGMAVLQKNDPQQTPELEPYFDGALSEQCNQYHECEALTPYVAAGKPVLNAEYHLATKKFCAADESRGFMGARFAVALKGKKFQPCW